MKIRSCDYCAVLLDEDKLNFPKDIWANDGSIDTDKAKWDGENWSAFCPCPVCNGPVTAT